MAGIIRDKLVGFDPLSTSCKYQVTYRYFFKNKTSDLPNVTPMCSKWFNDVLQEHWVANDNVQYLIREIHEVAEQDISNPRCEIILEELPC